MAFSAAEIAERDKRKRALMDKLFGSKTSAGGVVPQGVPASPGVRGYPKSEPVEQTAQTQGTDRMGMPDWKKKALQAGNIMGGGGDYEYPNLPKIATDAVKANWADAKKRAEALALQPPPAVPAAQPQDKENYAQSITGLGQGITPYPGGPSTERKMTGEAAVQQKPNGSLVQIVPDKPQAPAVAAPPPISEYAYERITPGGGLEGVSSDGQVSSIAGWMDEPKNRTVKYRGPVVPGAFQWGDIEESTYGGEKIRRAPDLDVQRLANQGGIDRQKITNQGSLAEQSLANQGSLAVQKEYNKREKAPDNAKLLGEIEKSINNGSKAVAVDYYNQNPAAFGKVYAALPSASRVEVMGWIKELNQ